MVLFIHEVEVRINVCGNEWNTKIAGESEKSALRRPAGYEQEIIT